MFRHKKKLVSRALDFLRVISLLLVVTELLLRREVIEFNLIPPPPINVLAVSEWEHKTYIEEVPEKLNFVLK